MDRQLNLTTQPPAASGRYLFLDRLRGLTLLSMIAYHTCWDAVNLFGADWGWFDTTAAYVWQQSICWSFLLLSGFCWQLGHRPLRRGLLVLAAGEAVSVVTRLATPDQPVYFGVLTLIGIGMLLLIPLDRLFRRVPAPLGLAVSALLFFALRNAKDGTFGFERWVIAPVPDAWYRNLLSAGSVAVSVFRRVFCLLDLEIPREGGAAAFPAWRASGTGAAHAARLSAPSAAALRHLFLSVHDIRRINHGQTKLCL